MLIWRHAIIHGPHGCLETGRYGHIHKLYIEFRNEDALYIHVIAEYYGIYMSN